MKSIKSKIILFALTITFITSLTFITFITYFQNDFNMKSIENLGLLGLMTFIVFIISIGSSILFSKKLIKPILELKDSVNEIATGNIDVKVEFQSNNEIGQLCDAFSKIVESTKKQTVVAKEIANGNFNVSLDERCDNDILNQSLNDIIVKIQSIISEVTTIDNEIQTGNLYATGELNNYEGGWKQIIKEINKSTNSLRVYIDKFPNGAMIIDKEYNIKYLNNYSLSYLNKPISEVVGKKCYDIFNKDDCMTENCACDLAMKQDKNINRETQTHPNGKDVDILYEGIPVKDENDNIVGALEIVSVQTEIKNAERLSIKRARYQENEVNKLIDNLGKLAEGNLDIKTVVAHSDEDTEIVAKNFRKINGSLEESTKVIKSYIEEVSYILNEMANNNLDVLITREYIGNFNEIKESLNKITKSFNMIIGEINLSAEQVASAASQVSDSGQALSQGSTEQASTVEEMSATITEVSEQTKENATNANKANELSLIAKEDAIKGNNEMKEMLIAMSEINQSSENISKIIKVIDEIAFQTNILALNAAVEAARAGQHGKGFAVVAEEVRNLAGRSANAAKETTELIENSISKVHKGTKIANETAIALDKIVNGVSEAATLVGNIANASNEQATAIAEINEGIHQVSNVTQMSTSTAEQGAAASEELSSQAQILSEMVSKFKLGSENNISNKYKNIENTHYKRSKKNVLDEVAITIPEIEISLDDKDFGKY